MLIETAYVKSVEEETLRLLSQLSPTTTAAYEVRTPKLFHFNPETSTQIQEYLQNAVSLKNYALQHYQSPTSDTAKPQCVQLGRSLGQWLRAFHHWSEQPANQGLHKLFGTNKEMQNIKKMMNYDNLPRAMSKFQPELGELSALFKQIADMAAAELQDEDALRVIHGDFWTGK